MNTEQIEQLKDLSEKISQWGKEKGLTDAEKQKIKLFEEVGELAKAIINNDDKEIADAIGDCYVVAMQIERIEKRHLPKRHKTYYYIDSISEALGLIASYPFPDKMNGLLYLSERYYLNFVQCISDVYDIISKRTGQTINGTFVKDQAS